VDVIASYHNTDHWGVSKTVDLIQRKHDIPNIWNRVRVFIQQCIECQRTKPKTSKTPIKWMPIPCQRWHTVHLDWIEGLPTCTQARYDSILVIVDSATRLTHLVPTRKDSTSLQTAQLLIRELIRHHGIPRVLRTDRDRRVTSQLWTDICKGLAIKPTPTVAFHPRANGAVERVNSIISQQLRIRCTQTDDWVSALAATEMAINSRSIKGSVYSPWYLNFGYHPTTIADAMLDVNTPPVNEEAKRFVMRIQNDFARFQEALRKSDIDDVSFREP
jgi:hypothetical protein